MIIGLDHYSDSENKSQTAVSYCCNTNPEMSQFYSNYFMQPSADPPTAKIRQMVFECFGEYLLKSGRPPSDVLILRKGSTHADNVLAIQLEVEGIKEVLRSCPNNNQEPTRLLYAVIDKNASQKFFIQKGRGDLANPNSGTLVNSEAVSEFYDFYLIPQQCNRGTVKPTYFRVIYSDCLLEEGLVEELIYSQCFNYMNWSGSIKVPAILQYAKKLAIFAGQYLNCPTSTNCLAHGNALPRQLYYI